MPDKKHFVYSSRTTREGLALINKARGDTSWDVFLSQAVAAHYGIDLAAISLPPSKFLEEQKAKRDAREAEKAAKKAAEKKAKGKVEKPAKKAARQATEAVA